MSTERTRAVLPPHLQVERFRTMPFNEPRVIDQDLVCANPDTQELYIYDDEILEGKTRTEVMKRGKVAIMRVLIDEHTSGYVADLRQVKDPTLFDETTPDDVPDDPEAFNEWQAQRQHERAISAIVFREEDGKEVDWLGDERFKEAAFELTRMMDERKAAHKKQKVDDVVSQETVPTRQPISKRFLAYLGF